MLARQGRRGKISCCQRLNLNFLLLNLVRYYVPLQFPNSPIDPIERYLSEWTLVNMLFFWVVISIVFSSWSVNSQGTFCGNPILSTWSIQLLCLHVGRFHVFAKAGQDWEVFQSMLNVALRALFVVNVVNKEWPSTRTLGS